MTAGGQALLQSVREGREKGVGPESQDGAADTPPLGAEQAAGSRWAKGLSGRIGCWSSCCGDWILRGFLATP